MNGWWLIVVGVLLVGFCIYQFMLSSAQSSRAEPSVPPFKLLLHILAVLVWVIAAYLFYNIAFVGAWMAFCYIVGSIAAVFIGRAIWRRADNYSKSRLEKFNDEYHLTVAGNNLRLVQEHSSYIDEEAKKRTQIAHEELNTELLRARLDRESAVISGEENQLRRELIDASKQTGLQPNDVAEVRRERALGQVKTEQKYEETVAVLKAGDILKTADIQVIKKLTADLADEVRRCGCQCIDVYQGSL